VGVFVLWFVAGGGMDGSGGRIVAFDGDGADAEVGVVPGSIG